MVQEQDRPHTLENSVSVVDLMPDKIFRRDEPSGERDKVYRSLCTPKNESLSLQVAGISNILSSIRLSDEALQWIDSPRLPNLSERNNGITMAPMDRQYGNAGGCYRCYAYPSPSVLLPPATNRIAFSRVSCHPPPCPCPRSHSWLLPWKRSAFLPRHGTVIQFIDGRRLSWSDLILRKDCLLSSFYFTAVSIFAFLLSPCHSLCTSTARQVREDMTSIPREQARASLQLMPRFETLLLLPRPWIELRIHDSPYPYIASSVMSQIRQSFRYRM
jgi:hypothetical protein